MNRVLLYASVIEHMTTYEGSASPIGMGSAFRYQKETARYLGAPLWMARKRHMS